MKCSKCGIELDDNSAYEYRGALSCSDCFEDVIENRDCQRREVMQEQHNKTKCFAGLDLGNSTIGKANREILAPQIEIASKESLRLKEYEGRI